MKSIQGPLPYWLANCPVIPVLTIHDLESAVPLAGALVTGGLRVLEVTLRTSQALEAVAQIVDLVPDAIVGVGSVIEPQQFSAARDAGAHFAVSPGASRSLHLASEAAGLPWLAGVQTVSEMLELHALGYEVLKLFPAVAIGGLQFLRSVTGPMPDMRFCPTGGISPQNAPQYLSLSNVSCVGGSWLSPADLVLSRRWADITDLAREAASMKKAALPGNVVASV